MGWLFNRGSDRDLAAGRYADRESASDRADRIRREKHRSSGARRAARAGEDWEDRDRDGDRRGGWYRPAR